MPELGVTPKIDEVLAGTSGSDFFQRLEKYLEGKAENSASEKCIRQVFVRIATTLEDYVGESELRSALRFILHLDQTKDGTTKWLKLGVTQLLEKVLATLSKPATFNGKLRKELLYEFYDTVMMLTKSSNDKGKELVRNTVVPQLLTMSCQELHCIPSLVEAMKVVNSLLQCCPVSSLRSISSNARVKSTLMTMGQKIAVLGDMELQMGVVEALFRVTTMDERKRLGAHCFHYQTITDHFLNIKDTEFEPDCRRFLNALNNSSSSPRRVLTLPCSSTYVGDVQLQRPKDRGLTDFWVDFNPMSSSMTLFIQDTAVERDMWDTVAVCKENVKSFLLSEGINKGHQLTIQLSEALMHISNSHQVKIFFSKEYDPRMALYQVLGKDLEKGAVAKRRANRMSVTIASLLISGGKTTVSESPMNSAANSQSSPARESPVVPRQLPCNTPSIHLSKMKTPKTSTPRSPASQCAPHSNLPVITQVSPHLLSQPIADGHEEDESPIMSSAPRPISIMEAGPNVSAADSVLTCGTQHEDHPEQESAHSDASAFQFTAPSQKKPRRTMRSSQRTVSKRTKDTSDDALLKQAPCPKASTTAAKEKAGNWGNQPKSCSPFGFPKDDALLPEPKPVSRVKRLESKRGRKPRRAAGSTKRTAGNKVNDKKDPKRVTAAGDDAGDDAVPTTPSDAYSSLHEPSKKPDRRPHAKQEKRRAVLDDVHFPGDVPSSTDNAESPPLLPSPTPIDSRGHVSEREAKTFNPSTKAGRKQGNSKAQSAEAHFPADSPTITDNEESPPLLQSPNMLDFKIRPSVKTPDQCMKDGRRKCHDERRKPQSSTISPTSHFPKPASQREVRTPPQSTPPQASQRMLTPCSVRLDRVSFSSRSPADVPTAIAKLQLKASSILEDFSASMLDVMAPVDPANAFRQEEPVQVNSEVGGAKGRGRHRKKKEQDRLEDSPLLLTAAMPLNCVSSAPQPDSENAWTAPNTPKCDRSDLSGGSGSDFDSFNHAKPPSEPQPRQPRSNRATRDSGVGHSSYNLSPHFVKGKSPSGSSKRNNTPRLMFEMTPVTSTRKKRGRREMDYTSNDDDRQQAKRRKPDRSIAQDIPEASNDLGVHTTHNLSVAPDEVVDHNTAADFLGTNSLSGSSSHLSFGRTPIQGNDIQSLLQGFGSCVSDSFKSKQRAMAGFTHSLSNYTANLVDDMWNANCHEREQALSSFNESVSPRLLALEKTFLVQQNMQDKMMATMKECIASLQSTRQAQHENLSGIKNNVLTYVKKMDTLATRQSDRKALLQRSLLTKSQQEQERMQQHITKMQVEQIRKTLRATVMQV